MHARRSRTSASQRGSTAVAPASRRTRAVSTRVKSEASTSLSRTHRSHAAATSATAIVALVSTPPRFPSRARAGAGLSEERSMGRGFRAISRGNSRAGLVARADERRFRGDDVAARGRKTPRGFLDEEIDAGLQLRDLVARERHGLRARLRVHLVAQEARHDLERRELAL